MLDLIHVPHTTGQTTAERLTGIEKPIRELATQCGVSLDDARLYLLKRISPLIIDLRSGITSDGKKVTLICINPLWIISWKDLPTNLQFSGPQDNRLDDRKFLQDLADAITTKLGLQTQLVGLETIIALRFFARLRENPPKLHSAWRCMTAHTLGDLKDNVHLQKNAFEEKAKRITITVSILMLTVFSAIDQNPVRILIAGLAITLLAILGRRLAEVFAEPSFIIKGDKFAAFHLKKAYPGAHYGFTAALRAIEDVKNSSALTVFERLQIQTTFFGNEPFLWKVAYGPSVKRIEAFKTFEKKKT